MTWMVDKGGQWNHNITPTHPPTLLLVAPYNQVDGAPYTPPRCRPHIPHICPVYSIPAAPYGPYMPSATNQPPPQSLGLHDPLIKTRRMRCVGRGGIAGSNHHITPTPSLGEQLGQGLDPYQVFPTLLGSTDDENYNILQKLFANVRELVDTMHEQLFGCLSL